jgi:hypothetical protein
MQKRASQTAYEAMLDNGIPIIRSGRANVLRHDLPMTIVHEQLVRSLANASSPG